MKVYIAGKITGDPDYRNKFFKAEIQIKELGCIVMNPAILPDGFEWEQYMPICFEMINACDVVVLLPDWVSSKGAQLEFSHCIKHNKVAITLNNFMLKGGERSERKSMLL